ncbi:MAG: hypothetical protein IPM91_14865 [Bacteroidetes bacterium]|nr:hypothetical protein [Bacteroidota bacterium]
MLRVYSILLLLFIFLSSPLAAQIETIGGVDQEIDFGNPKEFELGGITVTGVQFLDERVLITLTGLNIGERYKIPGDKISGAIENLWKQGLLSDIKVVAEKITGDRIFLNFQLVERPRLSKFSFSGISKMKRINCAINFSLSKEK